MVKGFNFVVGLIIVIVLHGCAGHVVEIKRNDVFYRDRSEKLPLKIGLFLTDKEKNYGLMKSTTIPKILTTEQNR